MKLYHWTVIATCVLSLVACGEEKPSIEAALRDAQTTLASRMVAGFEPVALRRENGWATGATRYTVKHSFQLATSTDYPTLLLALAKQLKAAGDTKTAAQASNEMTLKLGGDDGGPNSPAVLALGAVLEASPELRAFTYLEGSDPLSGLKTWPNFKWVLAALSILDTKGIPIGAPKGTLMPVTEHLEISYIKTEKGWTPEAQK